MKSIIKKTLTSLILIITIFSLSSCIFEIEDFNLLVPLAVEVNIEGTDPYISDIETFDLNESNIYEDNFDKIKEIDLLEISFRAMEVEPIDLSGIVTITLQNANNQNIFVYEMERMIVADYIKSPIKLELTSAQIQAMNAYIQVTGNTGFTSIVEVADITPSNGENHIVIGNVDIIFNTTLKKN